MTDNASHLRNQTQVLIGNNQEHEDNDDIYSEEDMYIYVNSSNNSRVFEKYIGMNKYYVFFILFLKNPFSRLMLLETTPSNIINIYHSKKACYNDCIYIFFNTLTNKVTHIRYITNN